MLEVAEPNPKQTMDAASAMGGFLWWYADLRASSGEGLVVIWSLGLPFLPGARENAAASGRPAVSVAHYAGGRQQLYLLQEYKCEDARLDVLTGDGVVGRSSYRTLKQGSDVELRITLNEPIPSSTDRLLGEIQVKGPSSQLSLDSPQGAHHIWTPKTVHAKGRATLSYGGQSHQIEGSAYFDSNVSDTPLHAQGISSWRWGRLTFPKYTLVYYEVEETDGVRLRYLYRQSEEGGIARVPGRLNFSRTARGFYGLDSPREVTIGGPDLSIWATSRVLLEDGPFYSRGLLTAKDQNGDDGFGYSETVAPGRIDRAWQRPLVRMRTHQVGRNNSLFLPLFNGPRNNRAERLFSGFASKGGQL